jgi:methionine-rich copper-binding protein CopC
VKVILEAGSTPTALTVSASPARLVCGAGAVVRLQLRLSEGASVQARLLSGRRALAKRDLGHLEAGMTKVSVKLPRQLARGSYRLSFTATAGTRAARTSVVLKTGSRRACSTR